MPSFSSASTRMRPRTPPRPTGGSDAHQIYAAPSRRPGPVRVLAAQADSSTSWREARGGRWAVGAVSPERSRPSDRVHGSYQRGSKTGRCRLAARLSLGTGRMTLPRRGMALPDPQSTTAAGGRRGEPTAQRAGAGSWLLLLGGRGECPAAPDLFQHRAAKSTDRHVGADLGEGRFGSLHTQRGVVLGLGDPGASSRSRPAFWERRNCSVHPLGGLS